MTSLVIDKVCSTATSSNASGAVFRVRETVSRLNLLGRYLFTYYLYQQNQVRLLDIWKVVPITFKVARNYIKEQIFLLYKISCNSLYLFEVIYNSIYDGSYHIVN